MKGSLDPKLEILGFNNYEIRHETYALTRIVYFVMTGKTKLETFKNKEFENLLIKEFLIISMSVIKCSKLRSSFLLW